MWNDHQYQDDTNVRFDDEFKEAIIKTPQCTITNMLDVIEKWKSGPKNLNSQKRKRSYEEKLNGNFRTKTMPKAK